MIIRVGDDIYVEGIGVCHVVAVDITTNKVKVSQALLNADEDDSSWVDANQCQELADDTQLDGTGNNVACSGLDSFVPDYIDAAGFDTIIREVARYAETCGMQANQNPSCRRAFLRVMSECLSTADRVEALLVGSVDPLA